MQFFKSTDGGKTTTNIRVPHGDNHDLWISATDNQRMVQSKFDGGGNVTVNGGRTWTDQDMGQFYNVFRHVPYHVCGAQQDNSTACVGSQVRAAARAACRRFSMRWAAARAATSRRTRTQLDAGQLRRVPQPARLRDRSAAGREHLSRQPDGAIRRLEYQGTLPVDVPIFSPLDSKSLYASSQFLWRTTNGGQSWDKDARA